jgi:hypothetical protein
LDRVADHVGIGTEVALPEFVTEHIAYSYITGGKC